MNSDLFNWTKTQQYIKLLTSMDKFDKINKIGKYIKKRGK